MSDRGSILISTANDIGEALVEKLEGSGYSPAEWRDEMNKLGIAEVDSAPALSVLEDSSETGTARGSILLSTANAIGAVLNKKYNTDRGFKPKEWASATSKLAPLPEKSAESSSICAIEDGADDVPSRSLVVTIPPTLTGESQIIEKRSGKNLLDTAIAETKENNSVSITCDGNGKYTATGTATGGSANITFTLKTPCTIKSGMYLHLMNNSANAGASISLQRQDNSVIYSPALSPSNRIADLSSYAGEEIYSIRFYVANERTLEMTLTPMICLSSSSIDYVPYEEPTTYTADLGRTIYGGSVDLVNGTGTDGYIKYVIDGVNIYGSLTGSNYMNIMPYGLQIDGTISKWLCDTLTANTTNFGYNSSQGFIFIRQAGWSSLSGVTDAESFNAYCQLHPITLILPVITPESFTFNGQEIPTKDGYNAFWSDQGNTALDYYGEPEPYTRGTASGAIANVQSARTDLPFTMVKANIAPNLTGVESVEVTKAGKNLLHITDGTFSIGNTGATATILNGVISVTGTTVNSGGRTTRLSDYFILRAGTYYISPVISTSPYVRSYLNKKSDNSVVGYSSGSDFTVTEDTEVYYGINLETDKTYDTTLSPQLEVGSSATAYTPYQEPTVYTADLGEPVYGGYADIVSGTGKTKVYKHTFTGDNLTSVSLNYGTTQEGYTHLYFYTAGIPLAYNPSSNNVISDIGIPWNNNASSSPYPSGECYRVMNTGSGENQRPTVYAYIHNTWSSIEDFKAWLNSNPITIVYEVETETEFTFDGQVISPSEGVNNLWNNAGGDTDVEYFTQE